jgi:hypothetical protein
MAELKLKTITAKLRDEVRIAKLAYLERIAELQAKEKAIETDDLVAKAQIGLQVEEANDDFVIAVANIVVDSKEGFTIESDIEQLETATARFRGM